MQNVNVTGTVSSTATLSQAAVDDLKDCYKCELSAVETYEKALATINEEKIRRPLQEILASHARRVQMVRERLIRAGAEVPESSGLWGAFVNVVQSGADLISTQMALASLEEGEDHGIRSYTTGFEKRDPEVVSFVRSALLPEQERTHALCSSLKSKTSTS